MDLSRWTGSLNELLKQTGERIKKVQGDPDLSREAKARKITELQQDFREEYARTRQDAEANLEVDRKMTLRRANPTEEVDSDNQTQIAKELRRARIRDDLRATWEARRGGPSIQDLESAIVSGDDLLVEVLETYGPNHIANEDVRRQFSRRVEENRRARMTDDQKAAQEELESLEKARLELGVALHFKDNEATRLSDTPASPLADTTPAA